MSSFGRLFVFFLLLLVGFVDVSVSAPSCLNFSKGEYSGNVTTQQECRTACELAEGWPEPDFKTSTCDEGTSYDCACKKCNAANSKCEYRDLCEDDVCGGAASTISRRALFGCVAMALLFVMV